VRYTKEFSLVFKTSSKYTWYMWQCIYICL